jgi:hypothetical protein
MDAPILLVSERDAIIARLHNRLVTFEQPFHALERQRRNERFERLLGTLRESVPVSQTRDQAAFGQ